ncbi:MAG TPA: hypothetical protein VFY45_28245 [Baekduia sp.]|nr:hypothetical protein [Baekduia sp.]
MPLDSKRERPRPVFDRLHQPVVVCVTYVCCGAVHLDVSGGTVPYVAGWAEDGALGAIGAYAATIDEIARRIEDARTHLSKRSTAYTPRSRSRKRTRTDRGLHRRDDLAGRAAEFAVGSWVLAPPGGPACPGRGLCSPRSNAHPQYDQHGRRSMAYDFSQGPAVTEILHGRGGFRTCNLSRVKNEELADPEAKASHCAGLGEVVRIVVELRRRSRWVDGQTVTGSATS